MRPGAARIDRGAEPAAFPAATRPGGRRRLGAYYLNAHLSTCVPRHLRADFEWMAAMGTDYVCVGVLEQDLWSAYGNLSLIIDEAERVGIRVLATPSRWAGLTAGAPKVPSMFSALHPHTWMMDARGRTGINGSISGVISSVHWPETFDFFTGRIAELYQQHPRLAGLIIDEPKALRVDHSPKAREVLGPDAPRAAHVRAAVEFYDRALGFARGRFPDKLRLLFMASHSPAEDIARCAAMRNLDYFGADGRPWDLATDSRWEDTGCNQESGRGKVLLDGRGRAFIDAARAEDKQSLLLIENHNLREDMIAPMDEGLPEVLALAPDLVLYYYFPRNVSHPVRAMEAIARRLAPPREAPRRLAAGA